MGTNHKRDIVKGFPERSYADQKADSEVLDRALGLDVEGVERVVRARYKNPEGQEFWLQLDISSLLTPYGEFYEIIKAISPSQGDLWVDLGAAYGRLGFALSEAAPATRFLGFESVNERVMEGSKMLDKHAPNAKLICQDISLRSWSPPIAHVYFIYDFGSRTAIAKIIEDLRLIAREHSITVIGRGRAVRDHIEQCAPWLSQVVSPVHRERYSIYRNR